MIPNRKRNTSSFLLVIVLSAVSLPGRVVLIFRDACPLNSVTSWPNSYLVDICLSLTCCPPKSFQTILFVYSWLLSYGSFLCAALCAGISPCVMSLPFVIPLVVHVLRGSFSCECSFNCCACLPRISVLFWIFPFSSYHCVDVLPSIWLVCWASSGSSTLPHPPPPPPPSFPFLECFSRFWCSLSFLGCSLPFLVCPVPCLCVWMCGLENTFLLL